MSDEPDFEHDRQYKDTIMEQCVWCGTVFGCKDNTPALASLEMNQTAGPVVAHDGTEYDVVNNSPPGSYLFHTDCWKEYDAEQKAEANKSLGEYVE